MIGCAVSRGSTACRAPAGGDRDALAVLAASAEGDMRIVDFVAAANRCGRSRHQHRRDHRMVFDGCDRQHPAVALVHAATHHRRRPGAHRLADRHQRRRGGVLVVDCRRRPRSGPGHDDEPAARRLFLAGLRRGDRRRCCPGGTRLDVLPRHAAAAAMVALAVGWGWGSKVMEGAGSALQIGIAGLLENSPVATVLLSVGPILLPSLPGLRAVPGAYLAGLGNRLRRHSAGAGPSLFRAHLRGVMGRISRRADPSRLDPDFAGTSAHDHAPADHGSRRSDGLTRRGPDDGHRHVERAGHRQSTRGPRVQVDVVDDARPAAGIRLASGADA